MPFLESQANARETRGMKLITRLMPNGWVGVTSFYLLEYVSMLMGGRLQVLRKPNLSQADNAKRTGLIRSYLSQSKVRVR